MINNPNRKLAAIMFTDIKGYTALMQKDEKKGVAMRERHRKIFKEITGKYSGTILQYYGDGTLSTFDSVVDAVKCGIEMQRLFSKKPIVPLRVGIHLGDIITTEEEVIGSAVNIASRIESLAIEGSILISDSVQQELSNHKDIKSKSLGLYEMKNVEQPMEIFAIWNRGLKIPSPDQISIKVKPYQINENDNDNEGSSKNADDHTGNKKKSNLVEEVLHRKITLTGPGGGGANQVEVNVSRKKKWWNYIASSAVIIGIIGSLAGTANIIKLNFFPTSSSAAQLTVYVHGPNGPQDIILENEGEIMIDFNGDRRVAQIGDNGRTVFTEVPEKFIGEPLHIMINSNGYEEAEPDKPYNWNKEAIYVSMIPNKQMGSISGIVKTTDGSQLISSARIIIENEYTTTTDSLGRFSFIMDGSKIQDRYNISILKEGYQPLTEYYYPNSSKEFRLKKI